MPMAPNRIRTIYLSGLNTGLGSKFCESFRVWRETPEEGQRTQWPKRCEYNTENENHPNTQSDKSHQDSSQTFRQTTNFEKGLPIISGFLSCTHWALVVFSIRCSEVVS